MIKIVATALICACLILFFKKINSELTILMEIMSGIILLFLIFSHLQTTFSFFTDLINKTALDESLYKIVFKVMAVGYLVEFGAGIIEDFGLKGLSDKLVFAGKVIIISISMPIIYAVINLITELLT